MKSKNLFWRTGAGSLALALLTAAGAQAEPADHAAASTGTRMLESEGILVRMLVDETNLGGNEAEIAEIVLPPDYGHGAAHVHERLEIFYVLDGALGHTVNGVFHRIEPGMAAIVRPGETVEHAVLSSTPVRAVLIWIPAGEAQTLIERFGFRERAPKE